MDAHEKPLMSFVILAYNQERFVREAVESAFSQTYSPLEIILSDDCSSDSTFEVMKQAAASYCGGHQIILNRNSRNLGLAGHVNRVVKLGHGDLLIGAAGDDVSDPTRAQVIFEAWEDSHRRATSIVSNFQGIDQNGRSLGISSFIPRTNASARFVHEPGDPLCYLRTRLPHVQGSTHAFSPRLFRIFGPLPENVVYEDGALGFRSCLVGSFTFVPAPLVKYRLHDRKLFRPLRNLATSRTALTTLEEQELRELQRCVSLYECFQHDLGTALRDGHIDDARHCTLVEAALQECTKYRLLVGLHSATGLRRLHFLTRLCRSGCSQREVLSLAPKALPLLAYRTLRLAKNTVRHLWPQPLA